MATEKIYLPTKEQVDTILSTIGNSSDSGGSVSAGSINAKINNLINNLSTLTSSINNINATTSSINSITSSIKSTVDVLNTWHSKDVVGMIKCVAKQGTSSNVPASNIQGVWESNSRDPWANGDTSAYLYEYKLYISGFSNHQNFKDTNKYPSRGKVLGLSIAFNYNTSTHKHEFVTAFLPSYMYYTSSGDYLTIYLSTLVPSSSNLSFKYIYLVGLVYA